MGRIHVLSEQVANKIAAGEVVERPASVVKELLENALDAGATRIRVDVEAGGKRLIQTTDNGCGMVRDDALLCFERHATSKIRTDLDLNTIATLGFRGEALPSIASVARVHLETRATEESAGTLLEINGGDILRVEEAGLPQGTSIAVRDLFFNTPARRKFLKAESTELSHIASLVTHYALAHPEKHFELHSATNALLMAPPVAGYRERVYQVFGKDTLDSLLSIASVLRFDRMGLPQPPPWRREVDAEPQEPGELRLHGFASKPELQKLNRNSIYIFANGRLIRDRLIQHAMTEAYRNILPNGVFPVVLLFLEMPAAEVDVNVHPSKTEVRFRQSAVVHDFVRDTVRAALMKNRPVPQFASEIAAHPTAGAALTPGAQATGLLGAAQAWRGQYAAGDQSKNGPGAFFLQAPAVPPGNARLNFDGGIAVDANASVPAAQIQNSRVQNSPVQNSQVQHVPDNGCAPPIPEGIEDEPTLESLRTLRPLGQIRNSFILAVNEDGLWIVDQHVAHERVLFEKILRQREIKKVESQRLLIPLIVDLTPAQQAVFAEIAEELNNNGFEAEAFGSRTLAIKIAPSGLEAAEVERMLHELFDQCTDEKALNMEVVRTRIAASIACHAAIKVNMALEQNKMEWLLGELGKTDFPFSCPHGRPVVLRYSMKDIQKAFKRI
jgi:DNA mismatch repair protein MutL